MPPFIARKVSCQLCNVETHYLLDRGGNGKGTNIHTKVGESLYPEGCSLHGRKWLRVNHRLNFSKSYLKKNN